MLFFDLPLGFAFFMLAGPKMIHALMHYDRWKNSDQDPHIPRAFRHYQLAYFKTVWAFPVRKHWRYWLCQIGVIALLFAPLDWLGANL